MNPILETTYNQVFELFTYLLDTTQFPEILDDWRSYADQVEQGIAFQDDCDGFAMTIAELLVRRAIPAETIRLVVCDVETGEGHLVCMVDGYMLDYRRPLLSPWEEAPYTWYMSMKMSEPGVWKELSVGVCEPIVNNTVRSYLSVSIPSINQALDISTRTNGDLVVSKIMSENSVELQAEIIAMADIDNISIYEGSRNQSVVLSGYGTNVSASQEVLLDGVVYRNSDPKSIRTSIPDTYLKPGDTAIDGEDIFTVDTVSYSVSTSNHQMDVQAL
jgi:hypothetical protein